jgi:DNA polymerase-4
LNGNVGVAGNKLVARIAAGCLERSGVCDVLRGAEQSFIGPLPTTVLPGIGPTRQAGLLQDLNIRFVQELAALSVAQTRLVVGAFAPLLHQRSRGIDPSPVCPPQKSPQVVEETFLARQDNDDQVLLAALCQLVEACGRRLRRLRRMTAEIVLCLTYADGVSHQRRAALDIPCNHDLELYTTAEDLLRRACERRVRIKGLRLECRQLCPAISQVDLFTRAGPSPRQAALQQALDQVRDKYGVAAVRRGRTLHL